MKHGKLILGILAAGVAATVAVKKGLIKNPFHQPPIKLHSAEEPVIQHPAMPPTPVVTEE